jgi:hypothetical protein
VQGLQVFFSIPLIFYFPNEKVRERERERARERERERERERKRESESVLFFFFWANRPSSQDRRLAQPKKKKVGPVNTEKA